MKFLPSSVPHRRDREPRRVVLHVVHSLDGGGTERTLTALLRSMRGERVRHMVATLRHPGARCEALPDHVACRPLHLVGRSNTAGIRLSILARRHGVGVLHARNTGCWPDALIAAMMTPKLRLVLGYHGRESTEPLPTRIRLAVKLGVFMGARFATVSHSGRDELCHLRIPKTRIDVIENGVELTHFKRALVHEREAIRTSLGLGLDEFVAGVVGSLTPIKRQDLFIHALAQARATVPRLRGLLIGDGPQQQELKALATKLRLGDCVVFLGQRGDVAGLLKALDVFVCTSDYECMSNAILEAMASGLPIVATAVGENPRLIRPQREGVLVGAGDAPGIAAALSTLANNQARRLRLGEAARLRATDFDFSRTVVEYENYYEALVRSSPWTSPNPRFAPAWRRASDRASSPLFWA